MMANKPLPNHADLQPYNYAVAGHDGTLCDPDGELFIKPCTQQEINFYESAFNDHKSFAELMPVYLGTLSLNDVTDMNSLNEQLPVVADHMSQEMKEEALRIAKEAAAEAAAERAAEAEMPRDNIRWRPNKNRKIATNKSVVLENAAYGFKRPNILDAKLGKRLWADDAPLEKRQRFDEISKATTNGSHGFRIAGMRVYKGSENPAEWDQEGYKVYGKDYGRLQVNRDNIVQEMGKFIFNPQAGIDEDLGKIIAGAFVEDLKRVERVLASEESRMYSASLLFTFEGDGEALRAAIEQVMPSTTSSRKENLKRVKHSDLSDSPRLECSVDDMEQGLTIATSREMVGDMPGLSASRVDSAIVLDDDGEMVMRERECHDGDAVIGSRAHVLLSPGEEQTKTLEYSAIAGFGAGADVDEIELDEDDDDDMSTMPRIYSLKLIDFAHASWVPGQGPDENNLLGVRSLIDIFEELSR